MKTTSEQKLRAYLRRMADIHGGNPVDEASYYDALGELLNAVGGDLKPKVHANFQLGQSGHGHPDFGLYTADQLKTGRKKPAAAPSENPARGVGEVKRLRDNLDRIAQSEQTAKYLDGYGTVLLTNYRGFALVERDRNGNPVVCESRRIAESEEAFWQNHGQTARKHGPALCEFLRRVMTRNAPVSAAEDIANLLASRAREAAATLQNRDASALAPLRRAMESSLGIKFENGDQNHFFRSTLVQTIFYGLFSAWMESVPGETFDWKSAAFALKTPVIRTLFSEIVNPVHLDDLGLHSHLDRAADDLNRVQNKNDIFADMGVFESVQHFYEPFLAAFDPELRKQLGVWYTPPEIVRYMTRRVHNALKTELNLPDGLASDNVRVLDPCGGTGAYLVETLRVIRDELEKRCGKDMAARKMKTAAISRVFGFEILPASFVVAHWQIGALLAKEGAPLKDKERAAVYLTNSLTGWEKEEAPNIVFPELARERAVAGKVKRDEPILVVIGNPPYNAFAGISPPEENDLVAPYKKGLREKWKIGKYNLDDLFVRFFRIAENRVVKTGRGIICYISNSSYATEPSFVVMRESLLQNFNRIWVDNMNGDSRATGKKTPDGRPDPSVFSTDINKAGIQVGTAVGLFVRVPEKSGAILGYRDFWGKKKRADLQHSLDSGKPEYKTPAPAKVNRLSFRPMSVAPDYLRWPLLSDLFPKYYDGMDECRRGALIDFDRPQLEKRMRDYFDKDVEWAAYHATGAGLARDAAGFKAREVRTRALESGFNPDSVVGYAIRPMDSGFCYYSAIPKLWNRNRPELRRQAALETMFLLSRKRGVVSPEGAPMFWSRVVADRGLLRGIAQHFPVQFVQGGTVGKPGMGANLSELSRSYLTGLGLGELDGGKLFMHVLAVGYSRAYRRENADGLRIDWPRIPLPGSRGVLEDSAGLGRRVRGFLDGEVLADEREVMRGRGMLGILRLGEKDLRVSAGWGYRDGQGKVFPGSGLTEFRDWTSEESSFWGGAELGLLGGAVDVYLNGALGAGTCFSGVPEAAWNFRIGGYQVLKKWLSYREHSVLDRDLREDEAERFTEMVRRLSGLVLLGDALDENYRRARGGRG